MKLSTVPVALRPAGQIAHCGPLAAELVLHASPATGAHTYGNGACTAACLGVTPAPWPARGMLEPAAALVQAYCSDSTPENPSLAGLQRSGPKQFATSLCLHPKHLAQTRQTIVRQWAWVIAAGGAERSPHRSHDRPVVRRRQYGDFLNDSCTYDRGQVANRRATVQAPSVLHFTSLRVLQRFIDGTLG